MARWDLNGGGGGDGTIGCGEAWRGGAPGRCVAPTGRRVVCGQRLSTLRRVDVTDLSKAKTKADGDGAALFAAPNPRFTARTLRRGVNSRRRERFVAKNFIGRALCLRGPMRSCTRRQVSTQCAPRGSLAAHFVVVGVRPGQIPRSGKSCRRPPPGSARSTIEPGGHCCSRSPTRPATARFPFGHWPPDSVETSRTLATWIWTKPKENPNSLPAWNVESRDRPPDECCTLPF